MPLKKFTRLQREDVLATYTFNMHTARHSFCRICGIYPFYRPRSHPQAIGVNVCCFDGEVLLRFALQPFAGVRWEENIDRLRTNGGCAEPLAE